MSVETVAVLEPDTPLYDELDYEGPGLGTWLVACFGLVLLWPGIIAIVCAVLSESKGNSACMLWAEGHEGLAISEASSARGLRKLAVFFGQLPLMLLAPIIIALALLGITI